MDLKRVQALKQKMDEATEFKEVWDYFLDHFGENPAFFELGESADDPLLLAAIAEAGRAIFARPVRVWRPCLRRIKEWKFIHGSVLIEQSPTSVIYFEEAHKGMLCVMGGFGTVGTRIVRFTSRALYEGLDRSPN